MSTGLDSEWKQNFEFRIEAARKTYLGDERLSMEATEGSCVVSPPGPDQEARLVRSERGRQRGELSIQRRREMRVSLVLFLEIEGSCRYKQVVQRKI